MKKILFILALCLTAKFSFAATFDPSLDWRTVNTEHFSIHFDSALEVQASKVSIYLEEAYSKLTPKLGWKPWGRTEVILTDRTDSANGMSSTLPYNWMILHITSPDPDSVLADYDNWLRELCFHEFTHVLHIDQYGGVVTIPRIILGKIVSPNGSVPGFIREGISTYIETEESGGGRGRASYSDMMIRTAVLNNEFLHIDEADGLQWKWPSYQSMYIYGVKFMEWLKENYGEDKIMEFNRRMGRTPLLFAVNHQARHVFNDLQFQQVKVANHYARVKKEGVPKSKTFYTLWNEWKADAEKTYAEQKAKIEAGGLTEFENVAGGETILSSPALSPDGRYLAYSRVRYRAPSELHLVDLETGKDKVIKKRYSASSMAFSPDSKKIVFAKMGVYKRYGTFSDIYTYDVETKKIDQLTKGLRASDPSYTPDGKTIIFVKQNLGRSWLAVYDIESKEITDLKLHEKGASAADFGQYANPVVSPDGKWIAVSSWQLDMKSQKKDYETGRWDLYLAKFADDKQSIVKAFRVSDDKSIDSRPIWGPSGDTLYFASDRDGVSNIYKVSVGKISGNKRPNVVRVTNVLTGVFQPAVSPDGRDLYVQYYNGHGYDIRKTRLSENAFVPGKREKISLLPDGTGLKIDSFNASMDPKAIDAPVLESKKYSPFSKSLFLPRFIIPTFATLDDAVMFGAFTGSTDPLRRHTWMGGVTYRTDLSNYVGFLANYSYSRYRPVFSLGAMGYAVRYQNYTLVDTGGSLYTKTLFEERLRGYGSVSVPFGKHAVGLTYFFENWESNYSAYELSLFTKPPSLGHYAGATVSYNYNAAEHYPASISRERGQILRTQFTVTDKKLGGSSGNSQKIFVGELREYLKMPWLNHVLAIRAGGGMVWGDEMTQGTFTMGGALGEGLMSGGGSLYYFPLRGLNVASLVGTRAMLISGEYRFPLVSLQRGFGTMPFYVQSIHFAPFVDFGNSWIASTKMGSYFFNNFLMSTGAELRGDFILGHGLPFTGRVGYGIVVRNRQRLGNVTDALLGNSLKDGAFILQLGTAF